MDRSELKLTDGLFGLYLFYMFMPAYFANSSINTFMENAVSALAVLVLLVWRYKPNKFVWLFFAYEAYLVVISFIFKLDNADIHMVISNTKTVVMICFIDMMLRRNAITAVNVMYAILLIYVVIDFMSVVTHPDGLYQSVTVWNQWSESLRAQWIMGNKNNRVFWYSAAVLLAYFRFINNRRPWLKLVLYINMGMSLAAALITQSSTSTVITIIIMASMFFKLRREKANGRGLKVNPYVLYGAYVVLLILIVVGSATFLSPLVERFFGKDMTFTGRAQIWENALELVSQKPVFGWGNISTEETVKSLGGLTFVNAHNMWLQILYQGGVVLLTVVVVMLIVTIHNIYHCERVNMRFIITFFLLAMLVEMVYEAMNVSKITWVLLLMCYSINLFEEFGEHNVDSRYSITGGSVV